MKVKLKVMRALYAFRQSSQMSLFDELANSIEEDSPLPELCVVGQPTTASEDGEDEDETETSASHSGQ